HGDGRAGLAVAAAEDDAGAALAGDALDLESAVEDVPGLQRHRQTSSSVSTLPSRARRPILGLMMKAGRYDHFGGVDGFGVEDVARPAPGAGQVLVAVKAAGINPGEASIRKGWFAKQWPSTFPSGQGSDLAGVVAELGTGATGWKVGDEVIGFVHTRSSQA